MVSSRLLSNRIPNNRRLLSLLLALAATLISVLAIAKRNELAAAIQVGELLHGGMFAMYDTREGLLFARMVFSLWYLLLGALWGWNSRTVRNESIVAYAALFVVANAHFAALFDTYLINDDVRQHLYWMRGFNDSTLFQNDLLADYAQAYQPAGFVLLYRIFSRIIDPVLFGKILTLVLFTVTSLLAYKIVETWAGPFAGFVAGLLFMVTPVYLDRMSGGLARGFGYPLVLLYLYCLTRKYPVAACLVLLLQCLFYPMVFLICAPVYVVYFVNFDQPAVFKRIFSRHLVPFGVTMAVCGIVLLNSAHDQRFGRLVTREQMTGRPEYYAEGRWPVLPTPGLADKVPKNLGKGIVVANYLYDSEKGKLKNVIALPLIFTVALTASYYMIRKDGAARLAAMLFRKEFILITLSSMAIYKIADWLIVKLFLPVRYVEFTLPVVATLMFSLWISCLIRLFNKRLFKNTGSGIAVAMILANAPLQENNGIGDASEHKMLYQYIKTLPANTMIAADPYIADDIPLYSNRKVLVNYKLSHAIYDLYWSEIKRRTYDQIDAFYGSDEKAMSGFFDKYSIDYLVVDTSKYRHLQGARIYFEPFDTYIRGILDGNGKPLLLSVPDGMKEFSSGTTFVVSTAAVRQLFTGTRQ